MTVRDIGHHLRRTLGMDLSHETIANVTDAVLEGVADQQNRPLADVYSLIYLDALVVKVRENNQVPTKSAHIVVRVNCEARRRSWASGCRTARARRSGPACAQS